MNDSFMDKRVFKRVVSTNGAIYQYPNQLVVNENHNKLRHHPVDCSSVVALAKSTDEPHDNIMMLNNSKTPLNSTTNTSTNYKRNDFRQCYDTKEAAGEKFSRIFHAKNLFSSQPYTKYPPYAFYDSSSYADVLFDFFLSHL